MKALICKIVKISGLIAPISKYFTQQATNSVEKELSSKPKLRKEIPSLSVGSPSTSTGITADGECGARPLHCKQHDQNYRKHRYSFVKSSDKRKKYRLSWSPPSRGTEIWKWPFSNRQHQTHALALGAMIPIGKNAVLAVTKEIYKSFISWPFTSRKQAVTRRTAWRICPRSVTARFPNILQKCRCAWPPRWSPTSSTTLIPSQ